MIMIFQANTIIYPGAVMIISFDTSIANTTVTSSSSSYNFTFGTELQWINNLHECQEINIFWL
jgi:hypothetical protein